MSWNDYSNYIIAENACTSGYVFGLTDGAIWAATSGETALPKYALKIEDDNGVENTVQVDETLTLIAGNIFYVFATQLIFIYLCNLSLFLALNNTNSNDGGKGVPPSKEFP